MKKLAIILIPLCLLAACAKIVAPTGGPRDAQHPKAQKFTPANLQTNLRESHIKIGFDEYIVLHNPNDNVIISPPMSAMPEFSVQGKSLIIKFTDTLSSNTTYNIGFSNCIKDFHEGNSIPFFQYIFSTGATIDSFMMSGKVLNAETQVGEKECILMLYLNDIDSLPLTTRPDYVTKSDNNGDFTFNYIKTGKYKIFALKDINNNLIYDLPNEAIAFLDDMVEAVAMPKIDTIAKDTTQLDTTALKSNLNHPKQSSITAFKMDSAQIILELFTAKDTIQKLDKYLNTENGLYRFPYKNRFTDFAAEQLAPIDPVTYLQQINETRDTVTWYFKDEVPELLQFVFTTDHNHRDTVLLKPYKAPTRAGRNIKPAGLSVIASNLDHYYLHPELRFSYPIKPVEEFMATLVKKRKTGTDTLLLTFAVPDTFVMRLPLPITLEEKMPYELLLRDSIFWGYNHLTNDSLKFSFTTKSEKDYGNLQINFKPERQDVDYVVMLQTSSGALLQKEVVRGNKALHYLHLEPGSCKITVIEDENGNGVWDTGDYRAKQQPERIIFFDKPITIRGFWDLEEDFIVRDKIGKKAQK
jgi:uncharacterized protein (DUF2141 family)